MFQRLTDEPGRIEDRAVLLPIRTALDMFQRLAMTTEQSGPTVGGRALFQWARAEMATISSRARIIAPTTPRLGL